MCLALTGGQGQHRGCRPPLEAKQTEAPLVRWSESRCRPHRNGSLRHPTNHSSKAVQTLFRTIAMIAKPTWRPNHLLVQGAYRCSCMLQTKASSLGHRRFTSEQHSAQRLRDRATTRHSPLYSAAPDARLREHAACRRALDGIDRRARHDVSWSLGPRDSRWPGTNLARCRSKGVFQ